MHPCVTTKQLSQNDPIVLLSSCLDEPFHFWHEGLDGCFFFQITSWITDHLTKADISVAFLCRLDEWLFFCPGEFQVTVADAVTGWFNVVMINIIIYDKYFQSSVAMYVNISSLFFLWTAAGGHAHTTSHYMQICSKKIYVLVINCQSSLSDSVMLFHTIFWLLLLGVARIHYVPNYWFGKVFKLDAQAADSGLWSVHVYVSYWLGTYRANQSLQFICVR